jgi:hypothetical protein
MFFGMTVLHAKIRERQDLCAANMEELEAALTCSFAAPASALSEIMSE